MTSPLNISGQKFVTVSDGTAGTEGSLGSTSTFLPWLTALFKSIFSKGGAQELTGFASSVSPTITGTANLTGATTTVATPSAGDNSQKPANTAWVRTFVTAAVDAALLTTHLDFKAVNGVYPGRPVTEREVWWVSWDVAPPATLGTTTSGTGPALGDAVFFKIGAVPG